MEIYLKCKFGLCYDDCINYSQRIRVCMCHLIGAELRGNVFLDKTIWHYGNYVSNDTPYDAAL